MDVDAREIRYFSTRSSTECSSNTTSKDQKDCTKANEKFYQTVDHNLRRIQTRIKTTLNRTQQATSYASCSVEDIGTLPSNFDNSSVKIPKFQSCREVGKCSACRKRLHTTMRKNDARSELYREYRLAKTRNKFNVKEIDQCARFSSQLPLFCQGTVFKVSNNSKNRCLIQRKDGSYCYKTVYIIPLSQRINALRSFSQSNVPHCCESRYSRKQFYTTEPPEFSNNFVVSDSRLTNGVDLDWSLRGFRYPEQRIDSKNVFCSSMPQHPRSNIPLFNTMRSLSACSRDEQIDPCITMNTSKELPESSKSITLKSRLMSFFRKTLKAKEAELGQPPSQPTLFQRFRSVLNALRTSDSASTITNATSGLSCWTCFEMDADDEVLSSVDSESGSDDNEDPDDGDGDAGCENDDFNNQEDIEAIEYSSDGGGEGSGNSSVNDDGMWQDDLMNQESNNNQMYDFDDCEDDEIEIARKAGFSFFEGPSDEGAESDSNIARRDWFYEDMFEGQRANDYEAEMLGISESRVTGDMDAYPYFP